MKNIFERSVAEEMLKRIDVLIPEKKPLWGKMDAAQMLAHCNVTYELVYEDKHKKPGPFKLFLLKLFVKNTVVNETPYKKDAPTAPEFRVSGEYDFDHEKARLKNYIIKSQELGEKYFENRLSHSFGNLSSVEWNNMFCKHLEHHLSQFGA